MTDSLVASFGNGVVKDIKAVRADRLRPHAPGLDVVAVELEALAAVLPGAPGCGERQRQPGAEGDQAVDRGLHLDGNPLSRAIAASEPWGTAPQGSKCRR